MGFGTVGGGTYDILTQNRDYIKRTQGMDVVVARILDRSDAPLVARGIDKSLFCGDVDALAADPEIELAVETMGGVETARSVIDKVQGEGN